MANVVTLIPMEPTYFPYERPPQPYALWTAIPRGLRGFIVDLQLLDAKPIGDTQTFSLTGTLPPGFAYVLSEISLTFIQDAGSFWEDNYVLNLQSFYQGSLSISMNWTLPLSNSGFGNDTRQSGAGSHDHLPKAPMWAPRGTSGVQINISGINLNTVAATAGTISAFINFWEFDLEQIRKYPVNNPLPVHSR